MSKHLRNFVVVCCMMFAPAHYAGDAEATEALTGAWRLTSLSVAGAEVEEEDMPDLLLVLQEGGSAVLQENGEVSDSGQWEACEEVVMIAIDEQPSVFAWSMEGDVLTLVQEEHVQVGPGQDGVVIVQMILERTDMPDEEQAPAEETDEAEE